MPIDVTPFAPEHAAEVYRLNRDAWSTDVPDIPFASETVFAAMTAGARPGFEAERHVALFDGVVAGSLRLMFPMTDNVENASFALTVAVGHRRRGVGRALFERGVQRSIARGRKNLEAETIDSGPEGAAFATAMGAKMALAETRSRLDVPPPDQERLAALLADAWSHAEGYRVVQWTGVPAEEYLDDIAALDSRYHLDAPMGDLVVEPQKIDGEKIRANEEHGIAVGRTAFHTGAVHRATGRMIGWTFVSGNNDTPQQAWQQLTLVDPAHRGHRLGLVLKLENLRFIRAGRPELTGIDTFNATANEPMLAVNDAMGYRRADQWMQWQLTL
jgi:GNAT superfamily N-acetyltransferase